MPWAGSRSIALLSIGSNFLWPCQPFPHGSFPSTSLLRKRVPSGGAPSEWKSQLITLIIIF